MKKYEVVELRGMSIEELNKELKRVSSLKCNLKKRKSVVNYDEELKELLKYDDLVKISNILSENGYNCSNVTVEVAVHTQKMLNRLNSDFFFRIFTAVP